MQFYLSRGQVAERLGISICTLWRMIRAGQFPPPVQISPRRVGWPENVLIQWETEKTESAAGMK